MFRSIIIIFLFSHSFQSGLMNASRIIVNMPKRKIHLYQSTYYHIYNRGFNKQSLFLSERDYDRFYKTIQRYLVEYPQIKISSFCFLPNHFHFLMWESETQILFSKKFSADIRPAFIDEQSDISSTKFSEQISPFMKKIQQSYAMYFNECYKESVKNGLKMPMFEGRFQAKEVTDEAYLEQLIDYIEYNAVKHELVDRPEDWPYSSFDPNLPKSGFGRLREDFDPIFE